MRTLLLFYKNLLQTNWPWLRKILKWSGLWLALGALFPLFLPAAAEQFFQMLMRLYQEILPDHLLTRSLSSVWLVFAQNARAALIGLFLGIIIGLVPLLISGFNAFVVGVIGTLFAKYHALSGVLLLLTLIPHGIFEIPALLISAAFGLRLGFFWKVPAPEISDGKKLLLCLKQNLQLVPLLGVLLALAAIVEVFVSGPLARYVAPQ